MDRPYISSPHGYFSISAPEICQNALNALKELRFMGLQHSQQRRRAGTRSIIEILPLESDWIDIERERDSELEPVT